ncbi:hypothetical protein GGR01_000729 [Acetobacter oeni]|nr:hypothetical protein [Acetobacter oeni]
MTVQQDAVSTRHGCEIAEGRLFDVCREYVLTGNPVAENQSPARGTIL